DVTVGVEDVVGDLPAGACEFVRGLSARIFAVPVPVERRLVGTIAGAAVGPRSGITKGKLAEIGLRGRVRVRGPGLDEPEQRVASQCTLGRMVPLVELVPAVLTDNPGGPLRGVHQVWIITGLPEFVGLVGGEVRLVLREPVHAVAGLSDVKLSASGRTVVVGV